MKDLVLNIKNVGLIKEASIKINGLTVIAGENDTGKSTVGKSLFFINQNSYVEAMHIFVDFRPENSLISFNRNEIDPANYFKSSNHFKSANKNFKADFNTTFIESPIQTNLFRLFSQLDTIQVDTPYEITYHPTLRDLYKKLKLKLKNKSTLDKDILVNNLKDIIDGEFIYVPFKELVFKRGNQEFDINSVATGIKNFGILQLLIKNNYLTKDSILIVDEPEVHLHPKWQLEYAKFIVELVKNGVKVLITSHSPYMIDAFEMYSKNINSNFYLANKKDNYSIIEDISDDLEPIYKKLAEPIDELEELDVK